VLRVENDLRTDCDTVDKPGYFLQPIRENNLVDIRLSEFQQVVNKL